MKILIIDNSAFIESNRNLAVYKSTGYFAKHLFDFGHKVSLFQFRIKTSNSISNFNPSEHNIIAKSVKYVKPKLFSYVLAVLKGIPLLLKNDFTYIFFPNSLAILALFVIPLNKKFGLYIRGDHNINGFINRILFKHASAILTVSDYFTDRINNKFGQKAETISPMISFTANDIFYRSSFLKNEDFNVLFLGRLEKDKGIFELIDAISILKSKHFSFNVSFVGNGSCRQELIKRARELDIEERVCFHGSIDNSHEIKQKYLEADIYILPTYHEGFPRTLYESMVFGVPIITTFVGGISSIMKSGNNCIEIKPKSVSSIVRSLEYSFNNYNKLESISRNASHLIKDILLEKKRNHAEQLNDCILKLL